MFAPNAALTHLGQLDLTAWLKARPAARSHRARQPIERAFEPDAIQQAKASSERDLAIGGPNLAAQAFAAGLVDECDLFLNPVVVGGGTAAVPRDTQVLLNLIEERRFASGVVHLRYQVRG